MYVYNNTNVRINKSLIHVYLIPYRNSNEYDNSTTWRVSSSAMLLHVALVRADVSEQLSASIIRVTRICEIGTTGNGVRSPPIFVTLMMEALSVPKRRFLQEPHGVIYQKTAFFIVTAVKNSNLNSTTCFQLQEIRQCKQTFIGHTEIINNFPLPYLSISRWAYL
jgi:hypothetical protein